MEGTSPGAIMSWLRQDGQQVDKTVANAVGRLQGKAAIRIHREYLGRTRNFTGLHFWARGYCVSTVGFEEAVIRQYIRNQEEREKRAEQLALGDFAPRKSTTTRRAGGLRIPP